MSNSMDIKVDVVVVGGGSAGIAAAYTAAKCGAQVALIEKNGFLGGMATAAYVGTVCGLFYRNQDDVFEYAVEGFAKQFATELALRSAAVPLKVRNGLKFLPYERQSFMQIADEWLAAQHVQVILNSIMSDVVISNNRIKKIACRSDQGEFYLTAEHFVDTSGFALFTNFIDDLSLDPDENFQAGAQVFGLTGLSVESEMQLNMHLIKAHKMGSESGKLLDDKSWISVMPGTLKNNAAYFKLSIPIPMQHGHMRDGKIRAYAVERLNTCLDYFKKHYPPLAQIELSMIAPDVGIRTGPRYRGDYVLKLEDVLACAKSENSSAKGVWPVEYWPPGEKVEMTYFEENGYYDIPVSCLKNSKVENLMFAGRHISATEKAIASARVMGTCMQMGESVGKIIAR